MAFAACWNGRHPQAVIRREPEGPIALDPQLVCYSWMTGILRGRPGGVRSQAPRLWVQYLRHHDCRRAARGIRSIMWRTRSGESSQRSFFPTVAFVFPRILAVRVQYVGLCLRRQDRATASLVRRPGAEDLGWLDELYLQESAHVAQGQSPASHVRAHARLTRFWRGSNGKEAERDTRFGRRLERYLCEVRAGQYWRLEKLKSFDEFLSRRFRESRRKAYYLMSIHEHLPPQARKDLKEVGWTKGLELTKLAGAIGRTSIVQPGCTKRVRCRRTTSRRRLRKN